MEKLEYIKTILLIDDDDVDIMAFNRAIKKTNLSVNVESLESADEVFDNLPEIILKFDCIFLDYQLPGTDGLQILKRFRQTGVTAPVIITTSQGDEKIAVEMMKAGAFDYFPKSDISPSKLIQVLKTVENLTAIKRQSERIENELKEREVFINKLTENSPNIISVYDLNENRYVYQNRSFFYLLGYSRQEIEELNTINTSEFLHEDDLEKYEQHKDILKYLRKDEIFEGEYRMKDKNGKWRWFIHRDISFKRNENGVVVQVLRTTMDITERKKNEVELLEAKQAAENASIAKAIFLSNMSHEIRTPMNAIMGLTNLLLQEDLPNQVIENLKSIHQSSENLLIIINDILDFSKIEAGKITLEKIDFTIRGVIDHLFKTLVHKFKEKGINFLLEFDEHVPEVVKGDPYRLNQILMNLTGNALKFTMQGEVKIAIQLLSDNQEEVKVRFMIKDSGIGIPESHIHSIFENYIQGSGDIARNFGGTGLGLTITKQLVDLQKGEIYVKSEVGKGSEFVFILSFPKSDKKMMDESQATRIEKPNLKDKKILVVEDNKINQFVIRQILEKCGATIICADNGQLCLDLLNTNDFFCIFMDLQMPVMDGYEATRVIRSDTENVFRQSIPIIALTADALIETRKKVLQSGFNDFLTKPFKEFELFQMINKYLKHS